jgi:hypothetical protein
VDIGYKAEINQFEGDPVIDSSSDGAPFSIYFEGCKNGRQCDVITFLDSYSYKKNKYSILRKFVDEWNSLYYSKAQINENVVYLTFPVIMNHEGIGPNLFQSNFETWIMELSDFRKQSAEIINSN